MTPIEEAQLVLENDQGFYARYTRVLRDCGVGRAHGSRREIIRDTIRTLDRSLAQRLNINGNRDDDDDAEPMRQYFDNRYSEHHFSANSNAGKPWSAEEDRLLLDRFDQDDLGIAMLALLHKRTEGGIRARLEKHERIERSETSFGFKQIYPPITVTEPQPETTMSTQFFQNKTFLNGQDISKLSNSEIYAAIAAKEGEIAKLESMKTQLKRSQREIEGHKADLKQLVEYLDGQDASVGEAK